MKKKIIVIIIFIAALILIFQFVLINFLKNTLSLSSMKELYGLEGDIIAVIEDKAAGGIIQAENGDIYIDTDVIKEYIDKYILWEADREKLTITTEREVIKIYSSDDLYYVNDEPLSLDMPFLSENGKAYLPLKTAERIYNISGDLKGDILNIDFNYKEKRIGNVKGFFCNLNFEADEKSANTALLSNGEEIFVLGEKGDFYLAKNSGGLLGYINKKNVSDIRKIGGEEKIETKEIWKPENGKINMVFDQIFKSGDKRSDEDRNVVHDGVDVLCPTWFSFENEDGDIKNIADEVYVENAHKNGYQVWALITDSFVSSISHSVLSDSTKREYVIKQLIVFCKIYNLDGINIDFEAVPEEDGENFVLFIRELAPLLRKEGCVLSVDVYKPAAWSMYYRRDELAKAADYIIVMGYDEHYAGGGESGSVASYDWSVSSVESMLELGIDKDKLILGIPFYTRIWEETVDEDGNLSVSSKAYSMEQSYNIMKEKGGEFQWLDDIGQYYCEVAEDGVTYKLWWENADSVAKRVDLVEKYDIAGCAAWKNGLESSDIWHILKEKLGKD